MIVILSDCLFSVAQPEIAIDLVVLTAHSRHLVVADIEGAAFNDWSKVAGIYGPRLKQMVNASIGKVAAGILHTKILVHSGLTKWNDPVPKLNIADARQFIPIPFKIFVENNQADKAFLLSLLADEYRETLVELELNHWLIFVHGGGTGDLLKQISWEANNTMRADLRCFSYFDNDGLVPLKPSAKSVQISEECQRYGIKHHQLARRAIENYIPISALELWASEQQSRRARHMRRQLTPFKKLSNEERDHFNMKSGPHGDDNTIIYPALSVDEVRQLQKGFGTKVATIYHHAYFRRKAKGQDFQRAAAEVDTLYKLLRTRI